MTPWIVWWFVIALVSSVALLACLTALVRQVLLLGRTARHMQETLRPVVTDIAAGAGRASRTAGALRTPASKR
jgi:hypothetical protein